MRKLLVLCLLIHAGLCRADDAKPNKQPKIISAAPLAISPGVPVKLTLRGLFLDDITEIKIGTSDLKGEIASKGKATVPQNYDGKRIGDTQAEIKFALPADTPLGKLPLIVVTASDTSAPYEILVASPSDLIEEKEPNDAFKTAQAIVFDKTVVGTIHDPRNVDVFEFKAQAGQKIVIRVHAARLGSPLDPFLTLYDATGQIVAGNDDGDGRDAVIEATLSKAGSYFITLQDANDSGGPHFAYLLKVEDAAK